MLWYSPLTALGHATCRQFWQKKDMYMLSHNIVKTSLSDESSLKSSESAIIPLVPASPHMAPNTVRRCIVATNTYANDRKQESPVSKHAISALPLIRCAPTFITR